MVHYQTALGALLRVLLGFTPQPFLLPEISARQRNDLNDGHWLETELIRPFDRSCCSSRRVSCSLCIYYQCNWSEKFVNCSRRFCLVIIIFAQTNGDILRKILLDQRITKNNVANIHSKSFIKQAIRGALFMHTLYNIQHQERLRRVSW